MTISRHRIMAILLLFLAASLPAHAYGDPSGGAIFQVLMPMLAAIWATWMIFANRVRTWLIGVYKRIRGMETDESAS